MDVARSGAKSSLVELVDKMNRSIRCKVISVGDDHVQLVHPKNGKVVKVPFSRLSANTIETVKALPR